MGLFDGSLPSGIQSMIVNLIKQAAPELMENVSQLSELVRHFKAQNDRIEAKIDELLKLHKSEKETDDGGPIERKNISN